MAAGCGKVSWPPDAQLWLVAVTPVGNGSVIIAGGVPEQVAGGVTIIGAVQLATEPTAVPVQVQVKVVAPVVTMLGLLEMQRFVVGGFATARPLADPHLPTVVAVIITDEHGAVVPVLVPAQLQAKGSALVPVPVTAEALPVEQRVLAAGAAVKLVSLFAGPQAPFVMTLA